MPHSQNVPHSRLKTKGICWRDPSKFLLENSIFKTVHPHKRCIGPTTSQRSITLSRRFSGYQCRDLSSLSYLYIIEVLPFSFSHPKKWWKLSEEGVLRLPSQYQAHCLSVIYIRTRRNILYCTVLRSRKANYPFSCHFKLIFQTK